MATSSVKVALSSISHQRVQVETPRLEVRLR